MPAFCHGGSPITATAANLAPVDCLGTFPEHGLALMRYCIESFTGVRTVLDPYMGAGSTLVAALQLGIHAVGIEFDEGYCRAAVNRLEAEIISEPRRARSDFHRSLPPAARGRRP